MNYQTTLIAAALISAATLAPAAESLVFTGPVTYNQPVTYASGVTYIAPVTYGAEMNLPEPVILEGIVVTPSRTYSASEYHTHRMAKAALSRHAPAVARYQRKRTEWTGLVKAILPFSR